MLARSVSRLDYLDVDFRAGYPDLQQTEYNNI